MKTKTQILMEFGGPESSFDGDVSMYYPAILCAMEEYAEQFKQPNNIGVLKDRLFKLANDFAVADNGDVAVRLHIIHNELP